MEETWLNITEATRYRISNMGNVYSLINNKPKLSFKDHKGYMRVQLYIPGKSITRKVHRLVAQHFIPNPHNLPQVNHKDSDKLNNNVSNLEWCTQVDNMSHSVEAGTHLKRKDIVPLIPQIKTAILERYILTDICDYYRISLKGLSLILKKSNELPQPITDLYLGRKRSYLYYDRARRKWRTELRKFNIPNKQFDNKVDAMQYVEGVFKNAKLIK